MLYVSMPLRMHVIELKLLGTFSSSKPVKKIIVYDYSVILQSTVLHNRDHVIAQHDQCGN